MDISYSKTISPLSLPPEPPRPRAEGAEGCRFAAGREEGRKKEADLGDGKRKEWTRVGTGR